jgi:hypothetical protein
MIDKPINWHNNMTLDHLIGETEKARMTERGYDLPAIETYLLYK